MSNYTFKEIVELITNDKALPEDFDQWELCDKDGWSVAHVAATYNHLPKNFNQWAITSNSGWTVAHFAAYFDNLPKDFNKWDLPSPKGTVREVYEGYNK